MSNVRNQMKSDFHSSLSEQDEEAIMNVSDFKMASLTAYLSTDS